MADWPRHAGWRRRPGDRGTPDSLELPAGSRYDARVIAERVAALEQRFREAGFLDVRVVVETVLDQEEHTADVHVLAAPGPRSMLSSVVVEGARPESPLIARNVNLTVGMPVDSAASTTPGAACTRPGCTVASTSTWSRPTPWIRRPTRSAEGDRQVVARVRVEERPRYAFRYGLAVNDDVVGPDEREQRFGFAADLENRNLLGRGATVGLSARLRRDQQIGRVFVGANRFFGLPLRSNLFLSRGREEIGSEDKTVSDVTEISAEQTYRLRRFVDVRYGYALGRNRSTFAAADFDLTVKVARLTTSGLVDRRNDPFDPARGWFTSASLELSRPGLGSDLSFLKSFLQYFQFIPIRDQRHSRVGRPRRHGPDVQGRRPHSERAILRWRRDQRSRIPAGRSRPAQYFWRRERRTRAVHRQRRTAIPDPPVAERCRVRRSGERIPDRRRHHPLEPADWCRRGHSTQHADRPASAGRGSADESSSHRSEVDHALRPRPRVLTGSKTPTCLARYA